MTEVNTNIEGLETQVFCVQSEDGQEYTFEITFTNNTKNDLSWRGTSCYYKQGENWKELRSMVQTQLLYGWGVLCTETAEYVDEENVTNTYTYTIQVPEEYDVSKDGTYKLGIAFDIFEGEECGTIWIIWNQE